LSTDAQEPEWPSELEIDDAGVISGEARIVLFCADCGDELKEYYLQVDIDPSEVDGLSEHLRDTKKENELRDDEVQRVRDEARDNYLESIGAESDDELTWDVQEALDKAMDAAESECDASWEDECELEVECASVFIDTECTGTRKCKRTSYLVEIQIEVRCVKHEWSVVHTLRESIPASSFEEVV
jgi:hypothetical protein